MNNETNNHNRIPWADYARAIAIILVVLNHAVETAVPLSISSYTSVSLFEGILAIVLFSLGRIGVPVFLMLTGYLLLDREWTTESIVRFWKTKWLRLLLVTELWLVIYNIYLIVYEKQSISWITWVEDLLFLRLSRLPHVYYMPMILGMYLLLPVIGIGLKKIDVKILIFPLTIYGIMNFGLPVISLITSVYGRTYSSSMNYGFSGGIFGFYIIMGYVLKQIKDKEISTVITVPLMYGSFIGAVAIQMWCYTNSMAYYLWYDNVFLLIYSVFVMILFMKMRQLPALLHRVLSNISDKSFGIYLTHILVIRLSYRMVNAYVVNACAKMVIYLALGMLVSWIIVTIISKVPVVGKWIFYR